MITTLLKVNQLFISVILIVLSLLGLLFLFGGNLSTPQQVISFLLVGILFISVAVYNQLIGFAKKSHFIVFFYLLFILSFLEELGDISFYSGYFFLSLLFFQVLEGKDYSKKLFNPFDFGFFGCIMLVLHPSFLVFFIAIILHFIMMGKTQINALMNCFLGILTGVFLSIEIIFIFDLQNFFYSQLSTIQNIGFNWNQNYYYLIPILLLGLISLIDYFQNINRQKTDKKIIFTNIITLLFAASIYLYFYGQSPKNFLVLVLPLALLLANFSLHGSKSKNEIAIWLIILSLVLYQISWHIDLLEILNTMSF